MTNANPSRRKVLVSWSSGKDCAWALHRLRRDRQFEVAGIFAVVDPETDRIPMHTTRRAILAMQAEALALPLQVVELPQPYSDQAWAELMRQFLAQASSRGVEALAFGDLFLEEIRAKREQQLAGSGLEALFPLWGIPTDILAGEMLDGGLAAWITSVDLGKLPAELAGKRWSAELLSKLPIHIDPCGENGEIHTVVVDGPMFRRPIPVCPGEVREANGFAYADLMAV